jgi:hypothetical protein
LHCHANERSHSVYIVTEEDRRFIEPVAGDPRVMIQAGVAIRALWRLDNCER